jgi:hypothetical protein
MAAGYKKEQHTLTLTRALAQTHKHTNTNSTFAKGAKLAGRQEVRAGSLHSAIALARTSRNTALAAAWGMKPGHSAVASQKASNWSRDISSSVECLLLTRTWPHTQQRHGKSVTIKIGRSTTR